MTYAHLNHLSDAEKAARIEEIRARSREFQREKRAMEAKGRTPTERRAKLDAEEEAKRRELRKQYNAEYRKRHAERLRIMDAERARAKKARGEVRVHRAASASPKECSAAQADARSPEELRDLKTRRARVRCELVELAQRARAGRINPRDARLERVRLENEAHELSELIGDEKGA